LATTSGAEFRYRITVENADDVKRAFEEIQNQYRQGITTQRESAEATRDLAREARVLTNEHRAQAQIFVASHPALMQLNNTMQIFASTARTALSVINALNLAQLAFAGQSDKVLQLQQQLVEVNRQILRDQTANPQALQLDYQKRADVMNQLAQAQKEFAFQQAQTAIILSSSSIMIASDIINIVKNFDTLKSSYVALKAAMASSGIADWLSNPYVAVAAAIAIATILIVTNWDKITAAWKSFQQTMLQGMVWLAGNFAPSFQKVWQDSTAFALTAFSALYADLKTIWGSIQTVATGAWTALKAGFVSFWNGLALVSNSGIRIIVGGIQTFVNSIVSAINTLISWYDAVAGRVGLPAIALVPSVALPVPQIPLVAAAQGFEGIVSRPIMFLAGEGGRSESISIRPSNSAGIATATGTGSTNVTIIVQGNLATQQQFFRDVDRYFKTQARRYGFNGLLA
jgi:hypothetical protein